jgi:hypothetical protein
VDCAGTGGAQVLGAVGFHRQAQVEKNCCVGEYRFALCGIR